MKRILVTAMMTVVFTKGNIALIQAMEEEKSPPVQVEQLETNLNDSKDETASPVQDSKGDRLASSTDRQREKEVDEVLHADGWSFEKNHWYFYQNHQLVKNKWIYDEQYQGWYYLTESGACATNTWVAGYYLKSDGKMAQNEWIYDRKVAAWYYILQNGVVAANQWIGSYYLTHDGKMAVNRWVFDKNNHSWYYVQETGMYVSSQWIGDYYLKENGKMAKSEWIYDFTHQSWYYIRQSGIYATDLWIGDYYLKSNGKMAHDEWIYDSNYQSWYYIEKNGRYAKDQWQSVYYLKSDGKMAKNEWVDFERFYVNEQGKKVEYVAPLETVYYSQRDPRWADEVLGSLTMRQTGCVPTVLAMIFSGLGTQVTPLEIAEWLYYQAKEMNTDRFDGTSSMGASRAVEHWGHHYKILNSKKSIEEALISGKTIFAAVGKGLFVSNENVTHAIVLSGYKTGRTQVKDPEFSKNTNWYSIDELWKQRSLDPDDNQLGGAFMLIE